MTGGEDGHNPDLERDTRMRAGRPAAPGRFTLVEMLIVVAVLCILFSLLMPNLVRAVERSRRTVCMSNMRQIYASTTLYTEDYAGCLPNANGYPLNSHPESLFANPDVQNLPQYCWLKDQPVAVFLQEYLGMKMYQLVRGGNFDSKAFITEPKGKEVYFCPSYPYWVKAVGQAYPPNKPNANDAFHTGSKVYGDELAYAFSGFGRWTDTCNLRNFGVPVFSRMGGSRGPIAFLVERFNCGARGGNHKYAGSMVMSEKGEGRWVDVDRLDNNPLLGGAVMSWPIDYYRSTASDWHVCYGSCSAEARTGSSIFAVSPPATSGLPTNWDWLEQYCRERRTMYGYRQ